MKEKRDESVQEMRDKLALILESATNHKELNILIDGLFTPQEIEEMMLRWRLLNLLLEGMPQREISKELGISLGKIARGSRLLQYGPPEFRALLERLNKVKD